MEIEVIRKAWCLHFTTHCRFLHATNNSLTIDVQLEKDVWIVLHSSITALMKLLKVFLYHQSNKVVQHLVRIIVICVIKLFLQLKRCVIWSNTYALYKYIWDCICSSYTWCSWQFVMCFTNDYSKIYVYHYFLFSFDLLMFILESRISSIFITPDLFFIVPRIHTPEDPYISSFYILMTFLNHQIYCFQYYLQMTQVCSLRELHIAVS